MKPWKRIEPTTVQKVGWRVITTKTFEQSDGNVSAWDVMYPDGQEFVLGVAVTDAGQVIIGDQFRPGPERVMQEITAGFVDKGETPEQTIVRELQEETGYQPGQVEYLGRVYKDSYLNACWHVFLLTECTLCTGQQLDTEEEINIRLISIDELLAIAKRGETTDAGAIFMAYDKLVKLKEGKS